MKTPDQQRTFQCGASVFNTSGQRQHELDLSTDRLGKTIGAMSAREWKAAAEALRVFDAGLR